VGEVSGISVQVQCDERSLLRHNPPSMNPDAVSGEKPDILGP
jgi:hypothetical protein